MRYGNHQPEAPTHLGSHQLPLPPEWLPADELEDDDTENDGPTRAARVKAGAWTPVPSHDVSISTSLTGRSISGPTRQPTERSASPLLLDNRRPLGVERPHPDDVRREAARRSSHHDEPSYAVGGSRAAIGRSHTTPASIPSLVSPASPTSPSAGSDRHSFATSGELNTSARLRDSAEHALRSLSQISDEEGRRSSSRDEGRRSSKPDDRRDATRDVERPRSSRDVEGYRSARAESSRDVDARRDVDGHRPSRDVDARRDVDGHRPSRDVDARRSSKPDDRRSSKTDDRRSSKTDDRGDDRRSSSSDDHRSSRDADGQRSSRDADGRRPSRDVDARRDERRSPKSDDRRSSKPDDRHLDERLSSSASASASRSASASASASRSASASASASASSSRSASASARGSEPSLERPSSSVSASEIGAAPAVDPQLMAEAQAVAAQLAAAQNDPKLMPAAQAAAQAVAAKLMAAQQAQQAHAAKVQQAQAAKSAKLQPQAVKAAGRAPSSGDDEQAQQAAAMEAAGAIDPMSVPVPPELGGPIYGWIRRLALQADLQGADKVLREAFTDLTSSLSVAIVYPGAEGLWTLGNEDEIPKDAAPLVAVAQARRAMVASHTALIPVVTSTETVAVIILTRNPRNPGFHPAEQVAAIALAREAAAILHHLAVAHLQKASEIKADQGGLYRGEALEAHRSRGNEGVPVNLSPSWIRRAYPLLVVTILLAVVLAIFIKVPTYSSGVGVVVLPGTPINAGGGTVEQVLVQPGQHVKKDQVLLRLSSIEQESELKAAVADADNLTMTYLYDMQDEQVKKTLGQALTRVKRELDRVETRLVRAKVAGTVSDLRVRVGTAINPGDVVLQIVDPSTQPEIWAFLPAKDRPRLRDGQQLQTEIAGYTKTREKAIIFAVAPEASGANDAAKYIGPQLADALKLAPGGSYVVVKAKLPGKTFKTQHSVLWFHHGMTAKTEVKIKSKPFIVSLLPSLEKYIPD